MTKARRNRLDEARDWFPAQGFTEESHIVKAYRKKFNVDRVCAMRELCLLGVLSPEKQKAYEDQLAAKARNRAESREIGKAGKTKETEDLGDDMDQDENFYYIAGYTSGGAAYGITWEQARKDGLV